MSANRDHYFGGKVKDVIELIIGLIYIKYLKMLP